MGSGYTYPYSQDLLVRRKEIWDNLQKGILFEDQNIFIPWRTKYARITELCEKRKDSGDRTNWYFGNHKVIDGYECSIEVMKWDWIPWNRPFSNIEVMLGFDDDGEEKFIFLKKHLTALLGEPTFMKPEEFGKSQIGKYIWINGLTQVHIIGYEQFALKYWLHIGLIQGPKPSIFSRVMGYILLKIFPNGL